MSKGQVTNVIGLHFAPVRVRNSIDKFGINNDIEQKLESWRAKKLELKKKGFVLDKNSAEYKEIFAKHLVTPTLTVEQKNLSAEKRNELMKEKAVKALASQEKATEKELLSKYTSAEFSAIRDVWKNRVKPLVKSLRTLTNNQERLTTRVEKLEASLAKKDLSVASRAKKQANLNNSKVELSKIQPSIKMVESQLTSLLKGHPKVELFKQYDAISKGRVRFNNECAITITVVIEKLLEEVIVFAMEQLKKNGKKIVHPSHYLMDGHQNLPLYCLLRNLPVYEHQLMCKRKIEQWEDNRRRMERIIKAEYKSAHDGWKSRNDPNEKEPSIKDFMNEAKDNGRYETKQPITPEFTNYVGAPTNFEFYVVSLWGTLKEKTEGCSALRISTDMRQFLDNLVLDFINRLQPWLRAFTTAAKVNTVQNTVVKNALRLMIIDGGNDEAHNLVDELFYIADLKIQTYKKSKIHTKEPDEAAVSASERGVITKK